MDYLRATAVSAAGMAVQKARIEAATLNLANMHSSSAPGTQGYRPVSAVIRTEPMPFARSLRGDVAPLALPKAVLVAQTSVNAHSAYEPGHPHADAKGMVSYPAVDPTQEMLTVTTALRTYEANLVALQATKTMAAKALEIGAQ